MSAKSALSAQRRTFLFFSLYDVSEQADYANDDADCRLTCTRFNRRQNEAAARRQAREIVRVPSGPCRIIVPRNPMTPTTAVGHIGRVLSGGARP